MSSEIAVGRILARQRQPDRAFVGHDALEALVARQAQQDARVVRIVLDDQQHRIALLDVVAVVGDTLLARHWQHVEHPWLRADATPRVAAVSALRCRAGVVQAAGTA